MNVKINKIIKDFSEAKTVDSKIALIRQHIHNSHFCWLLQKTYGPANIYESVNVSSVDPSVVEKTEVVSGLSLPINGDVKIKDVVEFLLNDRRTFGGKSDIVMARCNAIPMKHRNVLKEIVNGTLFGLSVPIINEAFGFQFIPEIRCFSTTDFRKDFFENGAKWKWFEKRQGSLISILKYGDSVEVYSKQGRIYRMFDSLRKAFSSIPADGMFQCQLYYNEVVGISAQKRFLQETAKKGQSDTFFCEVFDFVPLSCFSASYQGKKYDDRYKTADFLIKSFIQDDRIVVVELKDFNIKLPPKCEAFIIDAEKTYGRTKPKNFMTWKINNKENKNEKTL